jgi:hypothetical protein
MARVDFAGALAHLVGQLGENVAVAIGGTDPSSPSSVVAMNGTLRAVAGGEFAADFPEVHGTDAPAVFGFEEHDSRFALDPLTFRAGHTRGDHLELVLGTIGVEVRPRRDDE